MTLQFRKLIIFNYIAFSSEIHASVTTYFGIKALLDSDSGVTRHPEMGGRQGGHAIFFAVGTGSSLLNIFSIPLFPYGGHLTNMGGDVPPLVTPLDKIR